MPRPRVSIQWQRPRDRAAPPADRAPGPVSSRTSIDRILRALGTPEVTGAKTPQAEAIGLLQLAAEIEHSLMVQYLYAAASLPAGTPAGADGRTKIMGVAAQEMGHLVSVQNLLLLVGGPEALHFGRDSIRAASADNPIPLVLEPVSEVALAKFVVAEMPAEIPDPDLRTRVDAIVEVATKAAGTTPHRVGALYLKLFWLFQPDDTPIAPFFLSPNPSVGLKAGWHVSPNDFTDPAVIANFEATRAEWIKGGVQGFILAPAPTAAAARDLITAISEQGEGLEEAHDSHFHEFLELLDALEAGQLLPTALPINPVARLAPAPDAGTFTPIVTPYARLWAELFDVRYNLLLLDLWHAFATPTSSPHRKMLIGLSYANMHFICELTEHLLLVREMSASRTRHRPSGFGTRTCRTLSRCAGSVTRGCSRRRRRSSTRSARVPSSRIARAASARSWTSTATSASATSSRATSSVVSSFTRGQARCRDSRIPGDHHALSHLPSDRDRARRQQPPGVLRGTGSPGSPGTEFQADGTEIPVTEYKTGDTGTPATSFQVKRQAARFRLYEFDDAAAAGRPAVLPPGATVEWSARLVNKKDAVKRPDAPPATAPTSIVVETGRENRVIDSGVRSIRTPPSTPVPLAGTYLNNAVPLGELRVDPAGNLLVLGGTGVSRTFENASIGGDFFNNPGWHDDVSDGPVTAAIRFADGTTVSADPAWVIVAPPDFAPAVQGMVTLHDTLLQAALTAGLATLPVQPSFTHHILPLITRARGLRWVHDDVDVDGDLGELCATLGRGNRAGGDDAAQECRHGRAPHRSGVHAS